MAFAFSFYSCRGPRRRRSLRKKTAAHPARPRPLILHSQGWMPKCLAGLPLCGRKRRRASRLNLYWICALIFFHSLLTKIKKVFYLSNIFLIKLIKYLFSQRAQTPRPHDVGERHRRGRALVVAAGRRGAATIGDVAAGRHCRFALESLGVLIFGYG